MKEPSQVLLYLEITSNKEWLATTLGSYKMCDRSTLNKKILLKLKRSRNYCKNSDTAIYYDL